MKLKLSAKDFSSLQHMYGEQIENLSNSVWQISVNCCGCSGDCGTNWMRS